MLEKGTLAESRDVEEVPEFHVHLISDATGETLVAISRAAAAQYAPARAVEHVYPFVRTKERLDELFLEVKENPGVVLYTLVDETIRSAVERRCKRMVLSHACVLSPVLDVFGSHLGVEATPRVGGQYILDAEYFRRIDALNFTMSHDDGGSLEGLEMADVVLLGVSRTSKTPTGIYLANRGLKVANVPIIDGLSLPETLFSLKAVLIVGMVASTDRLLQIRRHRLESMKTGVNSDYVDRRSVAREVAKTRELCERHGWPVLDVTRRSVEETAAEIMALFRENQREYS